MPSERLQDAIVRVGGNHNPIITDQQSEFQLLIPGLKSGNGFVLTGVSKAGYELQEPELAGRTMPFSEKVKMEIIMVSRQLLRQEKQRIVDKAREQLEQHYEEQINDINNRLTQAQITAQQYENQLAELEAKYARMEPLIEQLSDQYARTYYSQLDSFGTLIQNAIEDGRLNEAQQLIMQKGTPEQREQKLRLIQQEAQRQLNDLAQDYYNLYTIHISRFENDSACYFLEQ